MAFELHLNIFACSHTGLVFSETVCNIRTTVVRIPNYFHKVYQDLLDASFAFTSQVYVYHVGGIMTLI